MPDSGDGVSRTPETAAARRIFEPDAAITAERLVRIHRVLTPR